MSKILKKVNGIVFTSVLVCALGFASCATTKGVIADSNIYESVTDAVASGMAIDLAVGKKIKSELSKKSAHVVDPYCEKAPVSIFKIEITKAGKYDLLLKLLPNGLISMDPDKKTAVIPDVYLYDSDMNLVAMSDYYGRAKAPTNTECFLFEVTGYWNVENPGTYYFVIKPNMSSERGISLDVFIPNGGSYTHYFKRTRYASYKLLIDKKFK